MGHLRIFLAAGVGPRLWLLAIVLVVSSALGLYYYLRIIVTMYQQPEAEPAAFRPSLPLAASLVLGLLTLLLVWLGVYPTPLLDVIRAALAQFV